MAQARSQGGANGCNCTPPPPPLDARSTWQAMNIIHLIVHCSTYLNDNCQVPLVSEMYIVHVCM